MLISRHSLSLQRTEGHTVSAVLLQMRGSVPGPGRISAWPRHQSEICFVQIVLHYTCPPAASTARHMHHQLHWGTQGVAPPTHSAMMMSLIWRRSGDTCIKSFDCHSLQLPVSRFIDICAKTVFKEKMP